jgi:hypothetical protein
MKAMKAMMKFCAASRRRACEPENWDVASWTLSH